MDGRVGKLLPVHASPDAMAACVGKWKAVSQAITPHLLKFIERVRRPIGFERWSASFPPARREALRKTRTDGNDMPNLVASSFLKRELAVKDNADLAFKDPRFIQGCPLELSASCGPSLRVLAKNVREGLRPREFTRAEIESGRQIIYTCGLNSEEVGDSLARATKLIEEMCEAGERVVYVEDDQSRFDLHLLKGPFKHLSGLYRKLLARRVASLLRRKTAKGVTNLGTSYSVPYTMQSGWPDTSVGDTLVNATMKFHIHGVGRKWISIICGDDSVTITTDREVDRIGGVPGLVAEYASLGMEVEAKIEWDPLQVGFCSGRFFPHGDSFILMPKTGKLLAKLCWDMVDRNPSDRKAWLRGIVATLKHYGQIDPLLRALGESLGRELGDGKVISEWFNEYKHHIGNVTAPSVADVDVYFDAHYALSHSDIEELASLLSQQKVGQFCEHPLLSSLVAADV